jgi:hypothetical protein
LQGCDYLINFDIHWNPVRISQRFGRIDRINSRTEVIQLVNFWPEKHKRQYQHRQKTPPAPFLHGVYFCKWQIDILRKKMQNGNQFNRQVEMNGEIRRLMTLKVKNY